MCRAPVNTAEISAIYGTKRALNLNDALTRVLQTSRRIGGMVGDEREWEANVSYQ